MVLTINLEFIQFDKKMPLVSKQPRVAPFVELGGQENSASSFAYIVTLNVNFVGEWSVLKMSEPNK